MLFRRLKGDWDWYNEEVVTAMVRIGTPNVLELVHDRYPAQPEYARTYLNGVLEGIHQDNSINCILPLLEFEDDDFLRGQLGVALASHFDDRGVEPAREVYYEDLDDPERKAIIEHLFTHACVANLDLPQKEEWGQQIEDDWKAFEDQREQTESKFDLFASEWGDENAALEEVDAIPFPAPSIDSTSRLRPIVYDGKRRGRNDPCPCGSGKKYKKCCMRHEMN